MKKLIGIIDADLVGREKHRFPNLVCEKISMYWKEKGATVHLITDKFDISKYSKIYVSKVFTDTPVLIGWEKILSNKKVLYGEPDFTLIKLQISG